LTEAVLGVRVCVCACERARARVHAFVFSRKRASVRRNNSAALALQQLRVYCRLLADICTW